MMEIISAKLVAREIVKSYLEDEIPWINSALRDAKDRGQLEIIYQNNISKPTKEVLIKLGYEVEELDECKIKITCKTWYDKFSEDIVELEEILKELNVEIQEIPEPQKNKD